MAESHRPPLLYVLPPGGFMYPAQPSTMRQARQTARHNGDQVREIDYPLGDPLKAWRTVRNDARRAKQNGRQVYGYGESAGGVLAALLAKRGIAKAAVSNAPPSNLAHFQTPQVWADIFHTGPRVLHALSPIYGRTRSPIMVQQSINGGDPFYAMNRRWAARDPRVRFSGYTGGHIYGDNYAANIARAMKYLREQRD
jgi:hypothetical protein